MDDGVIYSEINTEEGDRPVLLCISGVEEHGMLDIRNRRQPGRTYRVSKGTEYVGQVIIKRGRQKSIGSRITA